MKNLLFTKLILLCYNHFRKRGVMMNQILSVDQGNFNNKKQKQPKNKFNNYKSSGPIEINKIAKFFAIAMIIFGVFMIGSGSYAMVKNGGSTTSTVPPVIKMESTAEKKITITVTHSSPLKEVSYYWNDEDPTPIPTNGQNQVTQTINMPTGTNILHVNAIDENNLEANAQGTYELKGAIQINLDRDNSGVKITAEGENTLSYLTYRWDDEEETRVDINSKTYEDVIEGPRGTHTLTVVVVDEKNNTETKEQDVLTSKEPNLEVMKDEDDPTKFKIVASDEEGLKKVQFVINGTDKKKIDLTRAHEDVEDRKEFEFSYKLPEGESTVEVTVFNESDISKTETVTLVNEEEQEID